LVDPREQIEIGIRDAVAMGWLIPTARGFCFSCGTEREVYEVGPNYPAQPPVCHECMVSRAAAEVSRLQGGDGPA
jgi:hypothetical protein